MRTDRMPHPLVLLGWAGFFLLTLLAERHLKRAAR